jgi:release factor glutamine methyltransferase
MLPANTVNNVLEAANQRLIAAGCDTPQLDAELLLAHVLPKNLTWLYLHAKDQLEQNQHEAFFGLIIRRENREPVAYIIGHKEFYALDVLVNQHVLIPRPETELLVETAIQIVNDKLKNILSKSKFVIADVGTGSGCIAIALAKHLPPANVFGVDISQPALEVARQNAVRHQVANRITFLAADLLEPLTVPVDMIVSNPPYVSQPELTGPAMMPEVNQFEPRLALDGGQDGLQIIQRLLPQAREKLKPGGTLLVEIGSGQGQEVTQLAQTYFPGATIQIKPDLAGLDRLLLIQNKNVRKAKPTSLHN